jgi:hypothetical protein
MKTKIIGQCKDCVHYKTTSSIKPPSYFCSENSINVTRYPTPAFGCWYWKVRSKKIKYFSDKI